MEKAYIVTKESDYYKDLEKYVKEVQQQKKLVFKFLRDNGIKAKKYYLHGDGYCNKPFSEDDKKEIQLMIYPTEEDKIILKKQLSKVNNYGLCNLKRNAKISKQFAQYCIDNKIIINLYEPKVHDYFKDDIFNYTVSRFKNNDNLYVKINNNQTNENIEASKGFIEIKLSEFYKKLEEFEDER